MRRRKGKRSASIHNDNWSYNEETEGAAGSEDKTLSLLLWDIEKEEESTIKPLCCLTASQFAGG